MASQLQLSRGRTVYGNGSFAPNTGQVSSQGAQGYMNRELRNNRGPDGMSDRRSGVAARALGIKKPHGPGSPPINPNPTDIPGSPSNPGPVGGSGGGPVGGGGGPVGGGGGPVVPPTVNINAAGQLELPYNQAFSESLVGSLNQYNQDLLGLQTGSQQHALAYSQNIRNAGINYDTLKLGTLNDNSARGVAFSSGYGQAVGRNANAYNNQINDLNSENTLFNNSTDAQRAAIIAAFNQMLQQGALQSANDAANSAGHLGYGGPPADPYGGNGGLGNGVPTHAPVMLPPGGTDKGPFHPNHQQHQPPKNPHHHNQHNAQKAFRRMR